MSPRRGFLALVGGSLVAGAIQSRASTTTPTLILPPALVPGPAARPLLDAMLKAGESQMHAVLSIGQRMPKDRFLDWLEDGLQRSMLFDPPDEAAEERRIAAAVAVHGSIIGAIRAGAL